MTIFSLLSRRFIWVREKAMKIAKSSPKVNSFSRSVTEATGLAEAYSQRKHLP